jgi:hypothetical protein
MNTYRCSVFGLCFIASPFLHATLIPVSGVISMSATGSAGYGGSGQPYSDLKSAIAPFTSFGGSVNGSATWTVANPPAPPTPGFQWTGTAVSSASQSGAVTGSGFSLQGELAADIYGGNAGVATSANAGYTFDLVFNLDTPMNYSMSLNETAARGHGFLSRAPDFSFSSVSTGTTLVSSNAGRMPSSWSYAGSGILEPGTYRFYYDVSAGVYNDPLGDFERHTSQLSFSTTARVPDTGSTLFLFGPVVALVAGFWKFRRRT